jgi:uncharacterized protein (DUF697 family)
MWQRVKHWLAADGSDDSIRLQLDKLRRRTPLPLFWLLGKTQSGKTSVIKYLTGADDAEIGHGFKPCTRFSREFVFPDDEAPLLAFLDTRGVDEPGYDPTEDLAQFNDRAHVVILTVKALDHAQENVLKHLHTIRQARPRRPVVLTLTCLHEAYPQQQHPQPYVFREQVQTACAPPSDQCPPDLARSVTEQCRRFEGLFDVAVPVDLTRPEDGFDDLHYGGEVLKQTLLDVLPRAYRQTLVHLEDVSDELEDFYARRALPHIVGYSTLAATAGAVPIPWLDLLVLPGVQTRMIYHLARLYGQPLDGTRFLELASTLGLGVALRQAAREVVKFIPYVGSVAGGVLAAASTFALGKAFCYYLAAVHQGHVPSADDLKQYYHEQLLRAQRSWKSRHAAAPATSV